MTQNLRKIDLHIPKSILRRNFPPSAHSAEGHEFKLHSTPTNTLTSSVLLAQVGKPPDVAQPHRVPDDAEEKLHFPGPRGPVWFVCIDDDVLLLPLSAVERGALGRRQDYGHSMASVAARPRIKRCHFVTIFGQLQCGWWRGHLMPKLLILSSHSAVLQDTQETLT